MDKHQKAINEFILQVIKYDPICSIYCKGSIGNNTYRPSSDIDIDIITWRYNEIIDFIDWKHIQTFDTGNLDVKFQQGFFDGIRFDILCLSPSNFHNLVMKNPLYLWTKRKIYYDSSGIAEWGFSNVKKFFYDNPDLDKKCKECQEEHAKWKKDKSINLKYKSNTEFVQSIDLTKAKFYYNSYTEDLFAKK